MDGNQRARFEIGIDNDIEIIPSFAKVFKAYYDALIKEGFSEEQAFALIRDQANKINF
ncbi:MAG: hypothetical protein ABF969_04195 [Sporolactobacillus sp.]